MSETRNDILSNVWWSRPAHELLDALNVEPDEGLDAARVEEMRERYGANEMDEGRRTGLRELLWESITSPMMLLLLAVAAVSLVLGKTREAIVMVVVVLIYVGVELYNKARSDRTMARLRELQAPRVTVLRDGERREVEVGDVVVGDVLPLQPGGRVAADGRLISSAGLLVDEAPLTGESTPQRKDAETDVPADADLAERPTAVFAGITVLDGQGKALVTAVGEETELGRVAELAAGAAEEPTPLQQEMDDLARTLAYVAVAISVLIPVAGLLRGYDLEQMILTWLALTFLMVPGQPPVIITMALALAAFELAEKDVVVSRLRGAETLGSVTAILSDKTGTMTQNKMAIAFLVLGDGTLLVWEKREEDAPLWRAFLNGALPAVPEGSRNPTDEALVEASETMHPTLSPDPGRLIDHSGFARGKEYRSLTYEKDGRRALYATGGPDFALDRSVQWQRGEKIQAFARADKEGTRERVDELAGQGRRVVGYARGSAPAEGDEPMDLTFVGCPALEDRVRQGVKEAIAQLRKAGVRTVMVTGDNAATASQVAQQVGLDTSTVVVGGELNDSSDQELQKRAQRTAVFARVTPEQKLLLAEALKDQGEVVAVTGDGVNDAPALRTAHIGVAMGRTGTDVAREAADLVLTDDDFSHLPDGVAIGRKAYENFSKGITYYLSAKAILLTAFLVPLVMGYPFPFTPLQIIAIELLMDLASSTIFISEAAEPGLMEQEPWRRRRFLSWGVGRRILRNLAGPAVAILAAYFLSLALGHEVASARTAAFGTWLLGHIVLALTLKQERTSLLERGLLANRFGVGWLLGMVGLVMVMVYAPFVRGALQTTRLSVAQWVMVIVGAVMGGGWLEVVKMLGKRRGQ
ncbi:MAG: cation-translocating P-type ATPase [Chloroflexota bacterium]